MRQRARPGAEDGAAIHATGSTTRARRRGPPGRRRPRRTPAERRGRSGSSENPKRTRQVLDAVVVVAEVVEGERLGGRDVRDVRGAGRHDDHVLVQHLVVLDVGPQRQRVVSLPGCGNTAVPATRAQPALVESSTNSCSEPSCLPAVGRTRWPAPPPRGHDREDDDRDEQGQPPAVERPWTGSRPGRSASTPPKATAASATFHGCQCHSTRPDEQQQRVDHQRAGDRHAVRRRQARGRSGRSA